MRKHDRKPRLCFVSSSGGHWEQLQKLDPLAEKYEGFFVTEKTQFDEPLGKYFMLQTDLKDKLMPLKMLWNSIYTVGIWIKERPDFVITTGTMVAYPFYLLAVLFHKKIVYIETFGRANMATVLVRKWRSTPICSSSSGRVRRSIIKKRFTGGVCIDLRNSRVKELPLRPFV